MTTYSQLKTYVKQLGGSDGPAGIGCINLTGGTEIQITHNPPGAGTRVVSVVPYMVGADKPLEETHRLPDIKGFWPGNTFVLHRRLRQRHPVGGASKYSR